MANPITGPFVSDSSNNIDGAGSFYIYQKGFKQAKPYNLVTSFDKIRVDTTSAVLYPGSFGFGGMANASATKGPWQLAIGQDFMDRLSNRITCADNSAYQRFVSKAQGDVASLGITLAERQKSLDMIAKRGQQLADLLYVIRKKRLPRLRKKSSSVTRPGKPGRKRGREPEKDEALKGVANFWLETSFGWIPLIQDVYNACQVLSSEVKSRYVKVSSAKFHPLVDYFQPITGSSFRGFRTAEWNGTISTRCGALVRVENPNLLLANRLGLLNPAEVLWDLVPFSFVVDWFANIGKFLGSLTSLIGLSISEPWCSTRVQISADGHYRETNNTTVFGYRILSRAYGVRRRKQLPRYSLVLKPFRLDLWKAITSWSLCFQRLSSARAAF